MLDRVQPPEDLQKPNEFLVHARKLADEGQVAEALAMLADARENWPRLPLAWDELVGRLHLMAGDPAASIEWLRRAEQRYVDAGQKLPRSFHGALGSALVALGRFEEGGQALSLAVEAGRSVSKHVLQAAIEAFHHADKDNLDAGPPTPYRVIAQAELMAQNRDVAAAAALLADHYKTFGSVPPAYEAAMRRMKWPAGTSEAARPSFTGAASDQAVALAGDTLQPHGSAPIDPGQFEEGAQDPSGFGHVPRDPAEAVEYLRQTRQGFLDAKTKVPRPLNRALGSALLALGKVEEGGQALSLTVKAGATLTQPALRAAIEAFHHADPANLDGGPATPYRIIAQAELMARERDFAAAAALLADQTFPSVPPAYEIAQARMILHSGDPETALSRLTQAAPLYPEGLPREARQVLGSALIDVGRFMEGGKELSRIAGEGAAVNRPDAILAVNRYRASTGERPLLDTRFPVPHTLVDPVRGLVYLSIPKNACTLLKATFVMNGPHRAAYLASGRDIHRFWSSLKKENPPPDSLMSPDYFRFVVLRDPARRLLSAYLEMFVRNRHNNTPEIAWHVTRTVRETQAALGISHNPERSISFAEFVRFLSRADDLDCDVHWMPQVCLAGRNLGIYDHVGRVDRLDETMSLLTSRFGMTPETSMLPHHLLGAAHEATYCETSALKNPFDALPRELDEYVDGVPMPEQFYTEELKNLILKRYAEDVALYASV